MTRASGSRSKVTEFRILGLMRSGRCENELLTFILAPILLQQALGLLLQQALGLLLQQALGLLLQQASGLGGRLNRMAKCVSREERLSPPMWGNL